MVERHVSVSMLGKEIMFMVIHLIAIIPRITAVAADKDVVHEYCERDTFRAECRSPDEVILIGHAQYGRMRKGHCVTNLPLGCSTDVRHLLSALCSARRSCEVSVASLVPEHAQPCHSDYRSYLEASYTCIKVAVTANALAGGDQQPCLKGNLNPSPPVSVGDTPVYLSSIVADETGCGSYDSPLKLIASPSGRRLRVWLMDFGSSADDLVRGGAASLDREGRRLCQVYAVLREDGITAGAQTICAGDSSDIQPVYTSLSSSSAVIVRMVSAATGRRQQQSTTAVASDQQSSRTPPFLLKVETFGCADPVKPKNGGMRRLDNDVMIMWCNDSNSDWDQWRLTCQGDHWVGAMRNCSFPGDSSGNSGLLGWSALSRSQGISLLLIVLIALVIGLVMVVFGSLFLCSRLRKQRETPSPRLEQIYAGQSLMTSSTCKQTAFDPSMSDVMSCKVQTAAGGGLISPTSGSGGLELDSIHSSENDYYKSWHQHQQQQQPVSPHWLHGSSRMGSRSGPSTASTYPVMPNRSMLSSAYDVGSTGVNYQLTFGRGRRPADMVMPGAATSGGVVEHVYESPKFDKKDLVNFNFSNS